MPNKIITSGLRGAACGRSLHGSGLREGTALLALTLHAIIFPAAWGQTPHLEALRYKNLGIACLEESRVAEAERAFRQVTELASGEALGYANLGVAALRLGQLELAASRLEQARRLEPGNTEVLLLSAEVQFSAGQWDAVMATARRVLELDPHNVMALYYLYRAAMAQPDTESAQDTAARAIDQLFHESPDNIVVCLRYARRQAVREDWHGLQETLKLIQPVTTDIEKAGEVFAATCGLVAGTNAARVENSLKALENVLRPTGRFRQDLARLQPPIAGLPLLHFSPRFDADLEPELPSKVEVRFPGIAQSELPPKGDDRGSVVQASLDFADVDSDAREEWLVGWVGEAGGSIELWRYHEGAWTDSFADLALPPVRQARFADFDSDGRLEVVGIGPCGLVMLGLDAEGKWHIRTRPDGNAKSPGNSLEIIDADNEGDLDLCLAAVRGCSLWRNRSDGAFSEIAEAGLAAAGQDVRQVVATDHDDDLDTDLVLVGNDGQVRLFDNRRHGSFQEDECGLTDIICDYVSARDFDNDGYEDLLLIARDGGAAIQLNQGGRYAAAARLPLDDLAATAVTDLDFDNDGWLDLALAGRRQDQGVLVMLRNRGDGTWEEQTVESGCDQFLALDSLDIDRDGDLDLVGIDQRGTLRAWRNEGGNANHWLNVELKGLRIAGSKNNVDGIGSKIEIKAGLFYSMRTVRRPVTHFGLGSHARADLMRVVWSNGIPQNHLEPIANQTVREPQVLKGSCPYLYCWNGAEFVFVTDTLAGAPLGLQVAEGVVASDNPRELLTIAREKIAPRDGQFVFQYTSELWETVYLDQVALWVIDHPSTFDVFTDQRFLPPPHALPAPVLTRKRVMPLRAQDTQGCDVTAEVLRFDHRYPERLCPTRYQGVVEPHSLTLEFGDVTDLSQPLLVLGCWIFWTDTSINVALSQDSAHVHRPTVVEVWHSETGWRPLPSPFGLPNGKDKWVLVDLGNHLDTSDARIRLRSESEIHWDQVFLADRVEDAPHRTTILDPHAAEVHFGGFNQLYRPADNGPHLYQYGQQVRTPVWMDMTGFATRYGDVTELLRSVDDRFVIFTAGDEVTIQFDASSLPLLPEGWQRDFLFYNDGWEKDSDRNTLSGQTVEPLPFHGMSAYPYPSPETYPTDDLHRDYQRCYNTRRIGPDAFRRFVKEYVPGQSVQLPWDAEPGVKGDHSK